VAELFVWDPKQLGLQVEEMDREHQVLIGMMNKLALRSEAGAAKAELRGLLDELVKYTEKHFADEEAYMRSIQFPKLPSHQAIRRQLLTALGEHVQEFNTGPGQVSPKLLSFLKLWLSAHIRGIDMQYAEHSRMAKSA
jgi:hemerythrin